MTDIVKTLIPKPQIVEDKKELVKIAEFNKFSCETVLCSYYSCADVK